MPGIGTCRDCREPILWAVTEGGKNVPLDPVKTAGGDVLLAGHTARVVTGAERARYAAGGNAFYVRHVLTCKRTAGRPENRKASASVRLAAIMEGLGKKP